MRLRKSVLVSFSRAHVMDESREARKPGSENRLRRFRLLEATEAGATKDEEDGNDNDDDDDDAAVSESLTMAKRDGLLEAATRTLSALARENWGVEPDERDEEASVWDWPVNG